MSTSTDINTNGNGDASHDHILRPRALKPGNPAVLRTMSEEGHLAATNAKENGPNGVASGQTR